MRFAFAIVAALLGVAVAGVIKSGNDQIDRAFKIPEDSCGYNKYGGHLVSNRMTPFIVGGKNADMHEFPFQITLQKSGSHSCGGSIISKRFILCAAHCFSSTATSTLRVIVGKHNLRTTDATEKSYEVEQVIKHPQYASSASNKNDIALLKLKTDIDYNDYVQPVCLAHKAYGDLASEMSVATGWGATRQGGSMAAVLQEVTVPVLTNAECAKAYPRNSIYDSTICAGNLTHGGIDSCQGDSGGPLLHLNENGSYVQVGITSWGSGCAQKQAPGVYTRVSEMWDWIWANAK